MGTKHYDVKTFTVSASLGHLTKIAHMLMHEQAAEVFAKHDLSFTQWVVLTKLREGTASTASDLCRAMKYDTGAFTRVLDELERCGYITRERSREDRRVINLRLTATGRKRSMDLTPLVVDMLNEALKGLSTAELRQLTHLLRKLTASLDRDTKALL